MTDYYTPDQPLRVLTVRQPYAFLIVAGRKRFETRTRCASRIGARPGMWLAIQAGASLFRGGRAHARRVWHDAGLVGDAPAFTLGAIVGVAQFVGSWSCHASTDPTRPMIHRDVYRWYVERPELPLGDFSPGRWAWQVADARPLYSPIPYRGVLGLGKTTQELRDQVARELVWPKDTPGSLLNDRRRGPQRAAAAARRGGA